MAEGPIRLAPVYVEELVFFGSDDGFLYCLDAKSGELKWKFRAGPKDRRLPGNGRIISRWPIRCGFVLGRGTIYFGAGVFPEQGTYVYAVSTYSGKLLWERKVDFVPQGYMLADETKLFIPSGRTPFHTLLKKDGSNARKLGLVKVWSQIQPGGTFGVLLGNQLASGPSEDCSIDLFDAYGTSIFRFHAKQMVVKDDRAYLIQEGMVKVFDRALFPKEKPSEKIDLKGAELWSVPLPDASTLVLSDDAVFVACKRDLVVLNAQDGKEVSRISVRDPIADIVLSRERVYLATSTGWFYCLGPKSGERAVELKAFDPGASVEEVKPESVFSSLKGAKGYAFVLGLKNGSVLSQLLYGTDYQVIAVDSDPERIDRLRKKFDRGDFRSRIAFHCITDGSLPYQKYIANLVTSEKEAGDLEAFPAEEAKRLLRPAGGILLLPVQRDVQGWKPDIFPNQKLVRQNGSGFLKWIKPALPGAGEWTHFYANPANTACSGDRLIKYGPVEIQWYGEPGPERMVDRHGKNSASVYRNGYVFIPGRDYCYALDAYNGTILWEREIANFSRVGAYFDSGNMVALDDSLLVAAGSDCLEYDAQSGKLIRRYDVNKLFPQARKMAWGYLASTNGFIFGSLESPRSEVRRYDIKGASRMVWGNNRPVVCSTALFGLDQKSGKLQWVYHSSGKVVLNPTISIADKRIVFVESRFRLDYESGRGQLKDLLISADLVALNLANGRMVWRKHLQMRHITDVLYESISDGVVLLTGSFARDTSPKEREGRRKPDQVKRIRYRVFAYDLRTGKKIWEREGAPVRDYDLNSGHGEAVQHPTIMNGILYGPNFAMSVKTGRLYKGWKWRKSSNCAPKTASRNCVFGREGNPIMYDLKTGDDFKMTKVSRPGCWISILPVGGLVLIPDADAGCTCEFAVQISLALVPSEGKDISD